MDVAGISEAVALIAATGAVQGLGEDGARSLVERIRARITAAFTGDNRSTAALTDAVEDPEDPIRLARLADALVWYAEQDPEFESELADWARRHAPTQAVNQRIEAGRDAYTAGRDMTIDRDGRAG